MGFCRFSQRIANIVDCLLDDAVCCEPLSRFRFSVYMVTAVYKKSQEGASS
jgi:hypothetical protein